MDDRTILEMARSPFSKLIKEGNMFCTIDELKKIVSLYEQFTGENE